MASTAAREGSGRAPPRRAPAPEGARSIDAPSIPLTNVIFRGLRDRRTRARAWRSRPDRRRRERLRRRALLRPHRGAVSLLRSGPRTLRCSPAVRRLSSPASMSGRCIRPRGGRLFSARGAVRRRASELEDQILAPAREGPGSRSEADLPHAHRGKHGKGRHDGSRPGAAGRKARDRRVPSVEPVALTTTIAPHAVLGCIRVRPAGDEVREGRILRVEEDLPRRIAQREAFRRPL